MHLKLWKKLILKEYKISKDKWHNKKKMLMKNDI